MPSRDIPASDRIAVVRKGFGDWMFDLALPFWAGPGLDAMLPGGARPSHEHLTLDGRPAHPGHTRMRVQARQLYVFATAHDHGVSGADTVAAGIYRFIVDHGQVGQGGWARRLRPDGAPFDPAADLYDIAFVLYAFAQQARATGNREPLHLAERTLNFLRVNMAHPAGGFANVWPSEPGWRQQNPHMHLLEAALALFEAGAGEVWLDLATEIIGLFRNRFLDHENGTLGEFFTQELRLAAGLDGDRVEPGHQAEWIWLLDRYQQATGLVMDEPIGVLARICDTHGVGEETGLMRDEIGRDGGLRLASSRLWPQTELLRALCVLHRRADDAASADACLRRIVRTTDNLLDRYLIGRESLALPPGTWIDKLDAFGRPMVETIPTSSLYHLMTAWIELDGFDSGVGRRSPLGLGSVP